MYIDRNVYHYDVILCIRLVIKKTIKKINKINNRKKRCVLLYCILVIVCFDILL